jgi:hypothetical protein
MSTAATIQASITEGGYSGYGYVADQVGNHLDQVKPTGRVDTTDLLNAVREVGYGHLVNSIPSHLLVNVSAAVNRDRDQGVAVPASVEEFEGEIEHVGKVIDPDRAAEVLREFARVTIDEHGATHGEREQIMARLEDALVEAGLVEPAPEPEPEVVDEDDTEEMPGWAKRLSERVSALAEKVGL